MMCELLFPTGRADPGWHRLEWEAATRWAQGLLAGRDGRITPRAPRALWEGVGHTD